MVWIIDGWLPPWRKNSPRHWMLGAIQKEQTKVWISGAKWEWKVPLGMACHSSSPSWCQQLRTKLRVIKPKKHVMGFRLCQMVINDIRTEVYSECSRDAKRDPMLKLTKMMMLRMVEKMGGEGASNIWAAFRSGLSDSRANISCLLQISSDSTVNSCGKRLISNKSQKPPVLLRIFWAFIRFIWSWQSLLGFLGLRRMMGVERRLMAIEVSRVDRLLHSAGQAIKETRTNQRFAGC